MLLCGTIHAAFLCDFQGNCTVYGCHGACQLLGLDPWRRLECGRKECGVMPSGRMECGVTPSGRRISLKGAVAHFFLSFFLPFSFLMQQLVCPLSRIEASCHNPFSLVLSRPPPRAALVLVVSRPPPRAALVLSDPVLGRHRAPFLSCPILSSAAAARRPRPCPATQSPVGPAITLCCVNHSSGSKRPSERNYYCHPRCLPAMSRCLPAMSRCLPAMLRKPLPLPP